MSRRDDDMPWMGPLPAAPGCDCRICRPDASYDDFDRQTVDSVLKHGWQVILVAADVGCSCCEQDHQDHMDEEHDDPGPPFAYTVGLGHRFGHPELLISGLDHRVMHAALNNLARRIMNGRRLAPDDALEDVLAGAPVAVEKVSEEGLRETVTWSGWFHRRKPKALAIVWPDRRGVFAWQPGAPEALDELQPPAWRVAIEHTDGLAVDPTWDFPVPPDHKALSCSHVVDMGAAVRWAARQSKPEYGEAWSIHCGADDHEPEDMRLVHFAHLIRSAPSLRQISDLGIDHEASRADTDSGWASAPVAP